MKSETLLNLMNEIDDGLLLRCEQETIRHSAFRKSMRKVLPLAASFLLVLVVAAWIFRPATVYVDGTTSGTTARPNVSSTTTAPIHTDPNKTPSMSWALNSYEELAEFIANIHNDSSYGTAFEAMVETLQTGNRILIPALDGTPAPLNLQDEYSDLLVSTSNDWGKPWIRYNFYADGEKLTVTTMYLSEEEMEAAKGSTVSAFLKAHYPDAPYPGNENKHPGLTIYEGEIDYNGAKVNALFAEFIDDKMEVYFLIDELLVCVLMDKDGFESGWSNRFSFMEMPLVSE
ncbi:MAG: hypothetical protein J6R82_00545 [Clostridia bacterium]|nr:hypothetical protein [Clostridia bacterium]